METKTEQTNTNKTKVVWEQENYPGDYPRVVSCTQSFDSKDEALEFVKQKRKSANAINRDFTVTFLGEVEQ